MITEIPEYAPDDLPIQSRLINNANLTTAGPAVEAILTLSPLDFTNNGSITANLANPANQGVTLQGAIKATNTGTITGNGGVALSLNGNGVASLNNSGTIAADGTFTNSGTIRSNLGAGAIVNGLSGAPLYATSFTNSGTINGVTGLGVSNGIGSILAKNSGTITGTTLGVNVGVLGAFDNQTGGTVNGGITAAQGTILRNAGTINGNTSVASTFFAVDGGVINGNLTLANGATVITGIGNVGQPSLAGVTGTIAADPGIQRLHLLVTQDTTAPVTTPFGLFDEVGYRLENGAKLTATSATPLTSLLNVLGHGTLDLTADINGTATTALLSGTAFGATLQSNGQIGGGPLAVISRGNLTKTTASGGAVVVMNTNLAPIKFTNEGTITLNYTGNLGNTNQNAVTGAVEVVNNGTIRVSGASAVRGQNFFNQIDNKIYGSSLLNTGLIEQTAALVNPGGIVNVLRVDNRGTISTFHTAIFTASTVANPNGLGPVEFAKVTNSGTISSSNAVAIQGTAGTFSLDNLAGGTISGGAGQAAITATSRATITNAGTINGNVALNSNQGALSNVFISKGGTLNGNLTFGGGDDIFVSTGPTTGVTGTLNGGAGTDTFVTALTANGTVDFGTLSPAATFERVGIGSLGADTVVTAIGPVGGLSQSVVFYGDGKIVNQASVNASGTYPNNIPGNVAILGRLITSASDPMRTDFTNQAVLADGLQGLARRVSNSGTIGNANLINVPVVRMDSFGDSVVFENSGSILRNPVVNFGVPIPGGYGTIINAITPNTATLSNSGILQGGLQFSSGVVANSVGITNSGTVTGYVPFFPGVTPTERLAFSVSSGDGQATSGATGQFTNTASGIISGDVGLAINVRDLTVANAGNITGALEISQANDGTSDLNSAAITNSGTITAALSSSNEGEVISYNNETASGVKTLAFTNSGSIRLTSPVGDQGDDVDAPALTGSCYATGLAKQEEERLR